MEAAEECGRTGGGIPHVRLPDQADEEGENMPYESIEAAREASFPTTADNVPLTLAQINKLAEIYDVLKREGEVENAMAVAWTTWKKIYKKEGSEWVSKTDTLILNIDQRRKGETEDIVIFSVRLTKEGIINKGLQTREEIQNMMPYLSGLPIIINHPDIPATDYRSVVVEDRNNAVGFTANVHEIEEDGILIAEGDAHIFKKNKEVILQIEGGMSNVSIGYSYIHEDGDGEFGGEKYSYLRNNVMPFHLALLPEETPACAPPACGIGLNTATDKIKYTDNMNTGNKIYSTRKLYIGGKDYDNTDNQTKEVIDMPDEPKKVIKQKEEEICIPDLSIDTLKESNKEVLKLSHDHDTTLKENEELKKKIDSLETDNKVLTGFKDIVETQIKAEVDTLRETVTDLKTPLEPDTINAMGKDELEHIIAVASVQSSAARLKVTSTSQTNQTDTSKPAEKYNWRTKEWS